MTNKTAAQRRTNPDLRSVSEGGMGPLEKASNADRTTRRGKVPRVGRDTEGGSIQQLEIVYRNSASLKSNPMNPRRHLDKQVAQLVAAICEFGFTNPILIDEHLMIIAGHGRFLAANSLGLEAVPTIMINGLTNLEKRALAIADNKLALNSSWDEDLLSAQLLELSNPSLDFDVSLTAFDTAEIDFIIGGPVAKAAQEKPDKIDRVDAVDRSLPSVSKQGDLWILDAHRLMVGNSLEAETFETLLGDERVTQVMSDPPFNVRIDGHAGGLGAVRHAEFAMASGEMTSDEFRAFLLQSISLMVAHLVDGAIVMLFMDWRHEEELRQAARSAGLELKNLVVWDKTVGGMGSLYRSQHELVLIFKHGNAPHINNVELGRHGRYRTNVWRYAGANVFRRGRLADLEAHPTIKPVALVMDAIKDCSRLKDIILDPFGGAGTTLLAAERTGRRGRLIEIDPYYADTTIRRWQALTGHKAVHAKTARSFADHESERDVQHPFI